MKTRIFTTTFIFCALFSSAQTSVTVCPGNTATLSAASEFTFWYNDSLFTNPVGSGKYFTTSSLENSATIYSVAGCELVRFRMETAGSENFSTTDHADLSGDDRGGIAVTNEYVYVVGDDYTARYDLDLTPSSGQQFPVRDGIFSDLATGKLYSLYSMSQNTDPSDYPVSFSFDAIVSLNPDLSFGSDTVLLSHPIDMGQQNGQNGIFAGMGYLIIYSGNTNHFYVVNLCSGNVHDLGFLADPELYGSENWADWGVAEKWNGTYSVVFRSFNNSNLVRRYLNGFNTEDVAVFSDLSDLSSITWSPVNKRWYFHNESTTPVFGGGEETVGYAGGDQITAFNNEVEDYTVYSVTVPGLSLGNDTSICSGTSLVIEAEQGYETYTWNGSATNSNIFYAGEEGEVVLEVTDINSCLLRDTLFLEAKSCNGIDGVFEPGIMEVWPNPATDEVNIFPGMDASEGLSFQMTDASGRIIRQDQWLDVTIKQVDVTDLAGGVYFLRLINGKEERVKKLVVH